MSFILPLLKSATSERHAKAVAGLSDGSLTVNITTRTDHEIRAIVTNGDGIEYGIHLGEHGAACDCADFAWRNITCKHSLAALIYFLQPKPEPVEEKIHLVWNDDTILCGATFHANMRLWKRWTLNALNWSDLVCQSCVSIYKSGYHRHLEMREAA